MTTDKKKCLYRPGCCYPAESGMVDQSLPAGTVITEPLRSCDGKFHKMTVINCKYPECI